MFSISLATLDTPFARSGPYLDAIIGGGAYSYIRVLPDGFLLKTIVFMVVNMNI